MAENNAIHLMQKGWKPSRNLDGRVVYLNNFYPGFELSEWEAMRLENIG